MEGRTQGLVLVCFALREERRFFGAGAAGNCRVILTGMGQGNARRSVAAALEAERPGLVLSCGYAGGLNPSLALGQVVFDTDEVSGLKESLQELGAVPGRFHCGERIVATALEKRALRESSGADAVEMESGAIRGLCRERGVPAATIRVISDVADEDLPMDFNQLAGADQNLSYARLAVHLARSPGLMLRLLRFRRRLVLPAQRLGECLEQLLRREPGAIHRS